MSLVLAYLVTLDGNTDDLSPILLSFFCALPFTIFVFIKLGLYRAVIRYIGQRALGAVFTS
ncbi:hypothetical protein [Alishewanella longhuensis]